MKEPTVKLTLAVSIDLRDELSKRLLKFGRVRILSRSGSAPREIDEAAAFVMAVAERAEIRPELGYTEILQGRTIKRYVFSGSSLQEILQDIKRKVLSAAYTLHEKVQELETAESQLASLRSEQAKLLPFRGISTDLSFIQGMRRFYVKFYVSREPVSFEEALTSDLERDGEHLITVVATESTIDGVVKRASALGLVEVQPPSGSPERMLQEISQRIMELEKRTAELSQQVSELKLRLENEVRAAVESLQVLREVSEIGRPVGRFLVAEVEILRSDLQRFVSMVGDIAIIGGTELSPDVYLRNPAYVRNFEPLTETQGVPSEHEIDPTPIISFVFPFFFGFMFPDMGQGLILFALGYLIYARGWKNKRKWGAMLASFGAAAAVMGALVGEVFGFDASSVPLIGGYLERIAVLRGFSSLTEASILTILSVAILIGIIHLASGFFIDFRQTLSRDRRQALLEKLPVLIAYIGAVFIGLSIIGSGYSFNLFAGRAALIGVPNLYLSSVTVPVTAASVLTFLVYTVRRESPLDASIQFMFIVIEFLANTISYSRLAILFLVHIVLMKTLNASLALGAASIPLIVFGNLGIMALEGLIVYIQSLRLHVYEWFTKFYLGSGSKFTGLTDGLLHASFSLS
ncbi:MAG: V-type ATPase 116kDa subunit family protein [Nitrososphaeria archaeon]